MIPVTAWTSELTHITDSSIGNYPDEIKTRCGRTLYSFRIRFTHYRCKKCGNPQDFDDARFSMKVAHKHNRK